VNPDLANYLRDLAERVARLAPSRTDPERFHIDKSELVDALRKLARDSDRPPPPPPAHTAPHASRLRSKKHRGS
jgi:hypothetical protein